MADQGRDDEASDLEILQHRFDDGGVFRVGWAAGADGEVQIPGLQGDVADGRLDELKAETRGIAVAAGAQ